MSNKPGKKINLSAIRVLHADVLNNPGLLYGLEKNQLQRLFDFSEKRSKQFLSEGKEFMSLEENQQMDIEYWIKETLLGKQVQLEFLLQDCVKKVINDQKIDETRLIGLRDLSKEAGPVELDNILNPRRKYHENNFWDTVGEIRKENQFTWEQTYNYVTNEMEDLGLSFQYSSFDSFRKMIPDYLKGKRFPKKGNNMS